MMKKTLALLLAVLMIFSTFVFTTAAEETTATTATQTLKIVPMSDCDSLSGWFNDTRYLTGANTAFALDTENYTQGNASIGYSF